MKKIIIMLIIFSIALTGCAISPEHTELAIENNDRYSSEISEDNKESNKIIVNPDEEQTKLDEVKEQAEMHNTPLVFESEAELVKYLELEKEADENNPSKGSQENRDSTIYYIPNGIPDGVVLSNILVKDFYIALSYSIDNVNDDSFYLFEWYRTFSQGDLQENLNRMYSPELILRENNYYIVDAGNVQDVFWEEQGEVFHAVTPTNITSEQLNLFCKAKQITAN